MSDFLSTLLARARGDAPGESPAVLLQPRPLARFEPTAPAGWDALTFSAESSPAEPPPPAPGAPPPPLAPPDYRSPIPMTPAGHAPDPGLATGLSPKPQPPPPAARDQQQPQTPGGPLAKPAPAPLAAPPLTPQPPLAPPAGDGARPSRPPIEPNPAEISTTTPPGVQPALTILPESERLASSPAPTSDPADRLPAHLEPALPPPRTGRLQPALPAPPEAPAPPPAAPPDPVINVTIGRVEIRAAAPAPAPERRPRPEPPVLSLDDYLRRRQQERKRR
jgi:hypothetical protein